MAFEANDALARFSLPMRGAATGEYDVRYEWVLRRPVIHENQALLASGNNTIGALTPLGATYQALILIPPTGTIDTWILKQVNGDAGVTCNPQNGPLVLSGFQYVGLVINAATGGYTITLRWVK